MTPSNNLLTAYVSWLIQHRIFMLVVSVVVTLAIGGGALQLSATNDMRSFFGKDNPQLEAFEKLESVYERLDNLVFVVEATGDADLFSRSGLSLIHELTERSWQAPYSRRVDSLTNYQHTRAEGDNLIVGPLVEDLETLDRRAIAEIKRIALSEPFLVNQVLGKSGEGAWVSVALTLPDGATEANIEVEAWATQLADELRTAYPQFQILIGGTAATDVALGKAVQRDIETLVGLSYMVIFIGLLVLQRHFMGTLAAIAVVTLSIATTMGLFGWSGAVLEPTAGFVPSIVMTIGVADAVHVLTTYYYELRHGRAKDDAIVEAMRVNAAPIALTSITTAIGVLMLNFSDSPPYQELGNMVAVGVLAAWALSMTFLPALLAIAPVRSPKRGERLEQAMHSFAEWLLQHRWPILLASGAVIITITSLIPSNKLGEKWHEYFDASFEIRHAIEATERHFGGIHILQFDMRGPEPGSINDPRYLADLEKFATWLEQQPEVTNVRRISQLIERLNMNLHGDDPEWRKLPDTRELTAQLLLIYELSLPLGMGLENLIDVERAGTRLQVSARRMDSEDLLAFEQRIKAWQSDNLEYIQSGVATGLDIIFAYINHRNITSLLTGMVLALVLISGLLVFALKSVKLGTLSLITNLAPAGLAYGAWSVWNGTIDLSASVVMCMSIGIVVDDTVHFLSKYRRARHERGADAPDALRYAFNTVGVALSITTMVLVSGFLVLGLSHFSPTVTTGSLLAITLAFALLVDFLFLPPLLLLFDKSKTLKA